MDRKERHKLNEALRTKPGVRRDIKKITKAKQAVMNHNADMQSKHWRITECSAYRPCNQAECLHCGVGVPFREHLKRPDYLPDLSVGDYTRGKSKNFKAAAGRGVNGVFEQFEPEPERVFAVRVSIYYGSKDMDCYQIHRSFRRRLRAYMKKNAPDVTIYLVADIAAAKTATFAQDWPVSDRDPKLLDSGVHGGLYLHAHGFIADHNLNKKELGIILRGFFIGKWRVSFDDPKPEEIDENGRLRGGYDGYIEYAAMEKTDLDMPSFCDDEDGDDADDNDEAHGYDNVAMFEAMYRARQKWPRNARKTKINHVIQVVAPPLALRSVSSHIMFELGSVSNVLLDDPSEHFLPSKSNPWISGVQIQHTWIHQTASNVNFSGSSAAFLANAMHGFSDAADSTILMRDLPANDNGNGTTALRNLAIVA